MASGSAALSDPPPMLRPATPPVRIASLSTPDPVRNEAKEAACPVEVADMRERQRCFARPSSDVETRGANRAVRGGESN